MAITDLIQSLGEHVGAAANVRKVYGDPVTTGDRTVIPIARVRYGFGAGGGKGREEQGGSAGGGGGAVLRPYGFLEITPAGTRLVRLYELEKYLAVGAAAFVLGLIVGTRR
jgi:uncharacterized spore protein YtfJ